MYKIIDVLSGNNANSNEELALKKIDSISITYNDDIIVINNNNIMLSTVIAKLLSDNVKSLSSDFFSMLSAGYTNSKKMKREQKGLNVKKAETAASVKLDVTTSASYELSAYAHIESFFEELETLAIKYEYNYKDFIEQNFDFFAYYHKSTYLDLLTDETVDYPIVERLLSVGIDCTMLSRRAPYVLLQLDITPRAVADVIEKLSSIGMVLVTVPYLNNDMFNFLIEEGTI
jgi:hypothetical protein